MPVRYDIAAQIPQYGGGGMDPMNMMVQLQGMDYRQQQNALAQLQMQKLQHDLQVQNALGGVLSNINVNDPNAINALARSGNLSEAISVMGAQRQAAALRAQEEAQRRTGLYQTGMLGLARAKQPLEERKLNKEIDKEARLAEAAKATAEKTALDRDAALLEQAENHGAKVFNDNGRGYDKFYDWAVKKEPGLAAHLSPTYDPQNLEAFINNAGSTRDKLKAHITGVKEGETPVEIRPGIGGAGPTYKKIEQVVPGKFLGAEGMDLPPEAQALQKSMATEQAIMEGAPAGREKEALGKYRFSNTLKGIGSTYVDLAKANGITVPGESPQETFEALANKSRLGTLFGKLNASERLALVDSLRSQVSTAIPQFAAAAGLQSKNFDSNAEGERLRAALSDPDNIANISSAFRILNDLNKQFGSGTALFDAKKETQGIIGARRAAGEPSPTTNLAPDITKKVNDIWGIK